MMFKPIIRDYRRGVKNNPYLRLLLSIMYLFFFICPCRLKTTFTMSVIQ